MANKSTNGIILTDVDGVLLNLLPQLRLFLREEKGIIVEAEDWKKGSQLHEIIGGDLDSDREIFLDFNHSDYFRSLPAVPKAVEAIKTLKDNGWRFVAITACMTGSKRQCYETTYQNRLENLEAHFGNVFEELHLTSWDRCKSDYLRRYQPTWWLEDSLRHANDGHDIGHKSLLIKTQFLKAEHNSKGLPILECISQAPTIIGSVNTAPKPHNRSKRKFKL